MSASRSLTLTQRDRQWADDLVHLVRSQDAYVVPERLPVRGGKDFMGAMATGLPGNRLKYRDLTVDELATNSADGRVLAPAALAKQHFKGGLGDDAARLPDGVKVKLGSGPGNPSDTTGVLDEGDLPNSVVKKNNEGKVAKTDLPGDTIYKNAEGNVPKTDLPKDVMYGNAQNKLSYKDDIVDKPNLSNYLTRVPPGYVKASELKPSAFKKKN